MNLDRVLAVGGVVGTVVFGAFSIWAYRRGEKRRVPTFVSSVQIDLLVHAIFTKFPQFKVLSEDQPIGQNGISAQHIYFWNDGQLPIAKADILEPYKITFPAGIRVLSYFISKQSRDVLDMSVSLSKSDTGDSITANFAVLEPGDGMRIQVIFDGPTDTKPSFSGSCIGSARVRVLPPSNDYFISRTRRLRTILSPFLFPVAMIIFIATYNAWVPHIIPKHVLALLGKVANWLFGTLAGLSLLLILWLYFQQIRAATIPTEITRSKE